ncbi:metal ABC transporter ATP-binding protein [Patescibacteria group bacterium]|nr:metal ABC transporter ATP-binding protein [Patescibacteria group bacterium]MBU4452679.1 metal ABC transporter ATP-binding protein [Patescibacteria group bacterium]MCG2687496.1 metal ABC transporter ATP-binding protein [Candidatus Parcubacteria bacterium]
MNLLEVKNLNVTLDKEKIIDNLSFNVKPGEILTILGPNGAGKSVLLRTLLGFIPYEGTVTWNKKPRIGYLPQGLSQLRLKDLPLTVMDLFALKDSQPKIQEVKEAIKRVGLETRILNKTAGHLSGGQFQRMLVAWVLISHPDVLFLDEPMSGIDIGGGETIYSLLDSLQEKEQITIFLVTHDLNIVYQHSTNVLCLSRKSHHCFGAPKKIINKEMLEEIFGAEVKLYEHH